MGCRFAAACLYVRLCVHGGKLPAAPHSFNGGPMIAWPHQRTQCNVPAPQGQANAWVRALEARSGLRMVKPGDANFLRTLENCVRVGNPVLIGALLCCACLAFGCLLGH